MTCTHCYQPIMQIHGTRYYVHTTGNRALCPNGTTTAYPRHKPLSLTIACVITYRDGHKEICSRGTV